MCFVLHMLNEKPTSYQLSAWMLYQVGTWCFFYYRRRLWRWHYSPLQTSAEPRVLHFHWRGVKYCKLHSPCFTAQMHWALAKCDRYLQPFWNTALLCCLVICLLISHCWRMFRNTSPIPLFTKICGGFTSLTTPPCQRFEPGLIRILQAQSCFDS